MAAPSDAHTSAQNGYHAGTPAHDQMALAQIGEPVSMIVLGTGLLIACRKRTTFSRM